MGGGGSQTVTQTNLPSYAKKYFTSLMDRANKVSREKYQPYKGQRLAGLDRTEATGIRDIGRMTGGSPYMTAAGSTYGQGIAGARDLQGFQSGPIAAGRTSTEMWGADAAKQYMSPYMEAVVDRQKAGAVRDYNRQRGDRASRAIAASAFGGSRQAVADHLATEALNDRLIDLDATGRQQAWQQAQEMFTSDQGRKLQSDVGNEDRSLQAMTAQEQARLGAAGIRRDAAQLLGDLGSRQQSLGKESVGMQRQAALDKIEAGNRLTQQRQRELDLRYSDFENQRDYDRQTLAWLSAILRGVPVSSNSTVSQFNRSNPFASMLGMGLGGLGWMNSQQG